MQCRWAESNEEILLRGTDKQCNVEGLKIMIKFLWEGLISSKHIKVELPLRRTDKKCNVEG